MLFRTVAAGTAVLALLAGGACGGVLDPSRNQTKDFSGTIEPQGDVDIHEFSSGSGEYDVRIASLTPTGNFGLVLTLAQRRENVCDPINQQISGTVNQTVLAGRISSGNYCLVVDGFLITEPVTYTIRVSHP